MERPSKSDLQRFYQIDKKSPEEIGKIYGVTGRSIRNWMEEYGIPRMGASHLRKGKSAVWNIGILRSQEFIEKMRRSKIGKVPPNYGKGRLRFLCEVCGVEVFDKPYIRKRTCSKECKNTLMSLLKGREHWNFKGENPASNQRQRNWKECIEWRKSVFSKYGNQCLACGTNKRLTAHHLDNWASHPEKRFEITNGVCLCWPCHLRFHREKGHKFCTSEMFYKWLTMRQ